MNLKNMMSVTMCPGCFRVNVRVGGVSKKMCVRMSAVYRT